MDTYRHPNAADPLADLVRLTRRVEALERSLTTARAGAAWSDDAGRVRVRVGPLGGGAYGVRVYDELGGVVWEQVT